jgi:hypothetical protein
MPQDEDDEILEANVHYRDKKDDHYKRQYLEWYAKVDRGQEGMSYRECLLAGNGEEELVYLWSFKESGLLMDPFDYYNDVVVTTDRLRLASQAYYKTFDCRTFLCWGQFYSAFLQRIFGDDSRPKMQSFLNFAFLEAFSTEHSAKPPFIPIVCPCYVSCCNCLTSCVCCYPTGVCDAAKECCALPSRADPITQIWLKWLQRYAKSVQPDMVLSKRPYPLKSSKRQKLDVEKVSTDAELDGESWPLQACMDRSKPTPQQQEETEVQRDSDALAVLRHVMKAVLHEQEKEAPKRSKKHSYFSFPSFTRSQTGNGS